MSPISTFVLNTLIHTCKSAFWGSSDKGWVRVRFIQFKVPVLAPLSAGDFSYMLCSPRVEIADGCHRNILLMSGCHC